MMKYFKALPDTDGDGLHDAEEDYGWMVHVDLNGDGDTKDSYENYHVVSDRSKPDTDGDGLNDAREKTLGTSPQYYDTDWDGLTDKYEVDTDWDAETAGVQGTNPLEVDTDGDGIKDGEEVNVYGTSPIVRNDRYAILLCTNDTWNFATDSEHLFKDIYRYNVNNIYKYEGSSATLDNFHNVIDLIASVADNNDIIYIGICSHGFVGGMQFNDGNGNPHGPNATYKTIDGWIDAINSLYLIISIDNCYSGSALPDMSTDDPSRVVYTSCSDNETSYVGDFDYSFPNALGNNHDAYFDADNRFGNGDGYVSVREAFLDARYYINQLFNRHPQESDPSHVGDRVYLGIPYFGGDINE